MNQISVGQIGHLGISLTFGLVIMVMIYAVGHISGAHMNPAVTLGFFSARRLPFSDVPYYIVAQLVGAVMASLSLRFIFFESHVDLGLTLPLGPVIQSFILELILSLILMFVIMGVATDFREQGVMAGVAIGATIAIEAAIGGPISGASMNPARSFGPALVSLNFNYLWIYLTAPIIGCMGGAKLYGIIRCEPNGKSEGHGCC